MKDYVEKISELESECKKLKSLEEDFKLNEKKLINDMKKKGDLARQMLSEKDSYISQLLSTNGSGSGTSSGSGSGSSGNGNGNNNINTSHNSHVIGVGKSSSSSYNSSSSGSGSSGSSSGSGSGGAGGVGHDNTTSILSSSSAPSSSSSSCNSNMKQSYVDQSNAAPSTPTPSNKSSSNPSISTPPNSSHQSYNQGREGSREREGGVNQKNNTNRSVTLSKTDQDQQAYLKQAFCGFLKAKEAVEMEHLGTTNDQFLLQSVLLYLHLYLSCFDDFA